MGKEDFEVSQEYKNEKWHVGKEVPLALVFGMAAQTLICIWWAASFTATVTAKLDELGYQVAALTADKYTQQDARRDMALVDSKIDNLRQSISTIREERPWQRNPHQK